jgi:hypothetical protein
MAFLTLQMFVICLLCCVIRGCSVLEDTAVCAELCSTDVWWHQIVRVEIWAPDNRGVVDLNCLSYYPVVKVSNNHS